MYIAWCTATEIFVQGPDGSTRPLPSAYAATARRHHASTQRRNAWKQAAPMQEAPADADAPLQIRPAGVAAGHGEHELLYLLVGDGVQAALRVDLSDEPPESSERRIRHGTDLPFVSITGAPDGTSYLTAVADQTTVNLGLMGSSGERPHELTEGDTQDVEPRALPGRNTLAYASRAIGRDAAGQIVAFGPSEILQLDLSQGSIETLASDPAWDLTAPIPQRDGTVLALRRRHVVPEPASPWRALKLFLLAPLRLLWTLLGWLQFTTLRYTGKLLTDDGKPGEPPQLPPWMQMGLAPAAAAEDQAAGAELVRLDRDGSAQILQRGVLAYDATTDGVFVWSDGRSIRLRDRSGEREVSPDAGVTRVALVGRPSQDVPS